MYKCVYMCGQGVSESIGTLERDQEHTSNKEVKCTVAFYNQMVEVSL